MANIKIFLNIPALKKDVALSNATRLLYTMTYYFNILFLRQKISVNILTLFRMGIFGAAHGWGGGVPLPKICHTYPTVMKLGTVIPYLKKIQKIYESRDTPSEFC